MYSNVYRLDISRRRRQYKINNPLEENMNEDLETGVLPNGRTDSGLSRLAKVRGDENNVTNHTIVKYYAQS